MWRALSLTVLFLAGCGGAVGSGQTDADLTLLLDEPPAGVHAGVFLALERGYDETEGLDLEVRGSGDPRRLLRRDRVQAIVLRRDAVADADVVCVLAITQTPEPDRFVCVPPTLLSNDRAAVEGLVRALQRGYSEANIDPESAVQAVLAARPGLDREAVAAELDAAAPSFTAGVPAFGFLREDEMPAGEFAYGLVGPESRD